MINVKIIDGKAKVTGEFDLGYMGKYADGKIEIFDSCDEIREWKYIKEIFPDGCSDAQLETELTKYYNNFQKKVLANIKQINDNFLIDIYREWEAVGQFQDENQDSAFFNIDMVERDDEDDEDYYDIYDAHCDEMEKICEAFDEITNDGSVKKPDAEATLKKFFPMIDFDMLIKSIVPECMSLGEGYITYQCSDNEGAEILCSAYNMLTEEMIFVDWHNF